MTPLLLLALFAAQMPEAAAQAPNVSLLHRDATPIRTSADSARHALARLAFGPSAADLVRVQSTGVRRWIDQQLEPTADPALAAAEHSFAVLQQQQGDLAERFADARREAAEAKRDAPPEMRDSTMRPAQAPDGSARADLRKYAGELQTVTILRAATGTNQLAEVMADFWFNHFNVFVRKSAVAPALPDYLSRSIRPHVFDKFETLLLAVAESPAMLLYLDNAESVAPGAVPPGQRLMDSPMARRRLAARQGISDDSAAALMTALARRRPSGLNENFARELLELHTLGVDGGYTQHDVQDVARIFSGWSVEPLRRGGGFVFNAWAHDDGAKTVMGVVYPAGGGRDEGRALLRWLARHPATQHHVSAQLCARLVADTPPDGCIDDAVAAWRRTDGDLRAVVRAVVLGQDFWAAANVGSKVKSPFEFVVSALRAVGARPDSTARLARALLPLGQPLFQQPSPAGYPESSEGWSSSSALFARMSFAVALAAGRLPGVTQTERTPLSNASDPDRQLDELSLSLFGGTMRPDTKRAIREQMTGVPDPAAMALGLALGSPDFQLH